jgi:5'-nucleotidase
MIQMIKELKTEHKVDYVIALTHMRVPNDVMLAEEVSDIDIILGGHDHHYWVECINDTFILKSGTDFKDFSLIQIEMRGDDECSKSFVKKIERFTVDSNAHEDNDTKQIVQTYIKSIEEKFKIVLGVMHCDLDGRFASVRSQETNLGNFICDIVLENVAADVALINSGTFRYDSIIPSGNFTVGDLKKILPFPDAIVVIECDGKTLYEVLENSVSQYPKYEGRFLQVSGVQFAFDPRKPSGSRIDPKLIKIQDEYLNFDQVC